MTEALFCGRGPTEEQREAGHLILNAIIALNIIQQADTVPFLLDRGRALMDGVRDSCNERGFPMNRILVEADARIKGAENQSPTVNTIYRRTT